MAAPKSIEPTITTLERLDQKQSSLMAEIEIRKRELAALERELIAVTNAMAALEAAQ